MPMKFPDVNSNKCAHFLSKEYRLIQLSMLLSSSAAAAAATNFVVATSSFSLSIFNTLSCIDY